MCAIDEFTPWRHGLVSMKSGLEGRNNLYHSPIVCVAGFCLNEVRPRRPEQFLEPVRLAQYLLLSQ